MKNTGELRVGGKLTADQKITLVNALGNLKTAEKESVKKALLELDRMLAELTKNKT